MSQQNTGHARGTAEPSNSSGWKCSWWAFDWDACILTKNIRGRYTNSPIKMYLCLCHWNTQKTKDSKLKHMFMVMNVVHDVYSCLSWHSLSDLTIKSTTILHLCMKPNRRVAFSFFIAYLSLPTQSGTTANFWISLEQHNIKESLSPGCPHYREATSLGETNPMIFNRLIKSLEVIGILQNFPSFKVCVMVEKQQ